MGPSSLVKYEESATVDAAAAAEEDEITREDSVKKLTAMRRARGGQEAAAANLSRTIKHLGQQPSTGSPLDFMFRYFEFNGVNP